jgi:hypothetical protein
VSAEILRRDYLEQVGIVTRLARQRGVEPADILAAVHAAMPDLIAPDDPLPVEASPLNLQRDQHGDWGLYVGDAWIMSLFADDPPSNPQDRRTALNQWLADALRPLFDGSVVTR